MKEHRIVSDSGRRAQMLAAGAVASGTLLAGALGHAPRAEATCLSVSGIDLGKGCKSAPFSIAIGLGDGAVAVAAKPFTFDFRIAHGSKTASKTPLQEFMDAIGSLLKGLNPSAVGHRGSDGAAGPEKVVPEKAGPEKVVPDKAAAEKAEKDRAATEKAEKDRAAAEKAAADKAAADKAAAEKKKKEAFDAALDAAADENGCIGCKELEEADREEAEKEAAEKKKKKEAFDAALDAAADENGCTGCKELEEADREEAEKEAAEKKKKEAFDAAIDGLDDADALDDIGEAPEALPARADAAVTKESRGGLTEPGVVRPSKPGSRGRHADTTAGDHLSESDPIDSGASNESNTSSGSESGSEGGQHSDA